MKRQKKQTQSKIGMKQPDEKQEMKWKKAGHSIKNRASWQMAFVVNLNAA
jgi:hypothetical protein